MIIACGNLVACSKCCLCFCTERLTCCEAKLQTYYALLIFVILQVNCPIVKLVLRNNALTALHGIEHLKSVEGLDLSYNIISNFSELEILGSLSSLKSLWLEGNPIFRARWYRAHVFSYFIHSDKVSNENST